MKARVEHPPDGQKKIRGIVEGNECDKYGTATSRDDVGSMQKQTKRWCAGQKSTFAARSEELKLNKDKQKRKQKNDAIMNAH